MAAVTCQDLALGPSHYHMAVVTCQDLALGLSHYYRKSSEKGPRPSLGKWPQPQGPVHRHSDSHRHGQHSSLRLSTYVLGLGRNSGAGFWQAGAGRHKTSTGPNQGPNGLVTGTNYGKTFYCTLPPPPRGRFFDGATVKVARPATLLIDSTPILSILPVYYFVLYFCHRTSHYIAWNRTYNPRPFCQCL